MSEIKLKVGKMYNFDMLVNTPSKLIMIDKGLPIFRNGDCVFTVDNHRILSEYTEPKKLNGWINVYKNKEGNYFIGGRTYDNKKYAESVGRSCTEWDYVRSLDLSQFNEGDGL